MIEEREHMLKVLWRTVDVERHLLHSFKDGTDCFFFKCIKLERNKDKYEMYNTGMQAYPVLPTSSVWYAYNNGIEKLSRSMMITKAMEKISNSKYQQTDATLENLRSIVSLGEKDNIPNLNQIKKDYESEQREDRQALQEV